MGKSKVGWVLLVIGVIGLLALTKQTEVNGDFLFAVFFCCALLFLGLFFLFILPAWREKHPKEGDKMIVYSSMDGSGIYHRDPRCSGGVLYPMDYEQALYYRMRPCQKCWKNKR